MSFEIMIQCDLCRKDVYEVDDEIYCSVCFENLEDKIEILKDKIEIREKLIRELEKEITNLNHG